MLFNVLPVLLIFTALGVIIVVVLRRLPEITSINTETIPEVRVADVKRQLLARRLERKMRYAMMAVWESTAALRSGAKEKAILYYQKLSKLEEHHRHSATTKVNDVVGTDSSSPTPTDQPSQLVRDANSERQAGRLSEAERLYLEAVRLDPRRVDAYLGLGLIYRVQRQYKEAIEALIYAKKLSHDNPSIAVTLGEVYIEAGRPRKALPILRVVLKTEPTNEHCLDRLLEAAILLGEKKLALATLSTLTEISREYPKLVSFKQRIAAIPSRPRRIIGSSERSL